MQKNHGLNCVMLNLESVAIKLKDYFVFAVNSSKTTHLTVLFSDLRGTIHESACSFLLNSELELFEILSVFNLLGIVVTCITVISTY
jgi:hypothetical protein